MISQLDHTTPFQARLRDRIVKAGAWTLGGYGVDLFVRLLSNLILTRLLFPEAFGAIAAAMALIVGLALISDFGVRAVIIQSPRGEQVGFLRSAWVFQLWRGTLLWIILVGLCLLLDLSIIRNLLPPSSVFANHSFALVTACLGFTLVLGAAESTCVSLNVRRLNYRPIVIIDLAGRICGLPVMLIWAWIAPSVWALVGGALAGSLLRLVLSHTLVPGPSMGLNWDTQHFHEIIRFGRWIVVASIATFISQQSDVIALGIIMPGSMLGLYSIAKLLAGAGEGLLDRLNISLALPALGEVIRKYPSNLRDRYYQFRLPIELSAGLLSGVLFAAGQFIVQLFYDPRYAQAGAMLQLLALGIATYPFAIIGNAFTATGDTHINAYISIIKAVSLIAFIAIGFHWYGELGAVGGIALHRIVPSVVILSLAHKRNWFGMWRELRIIPAFVVGILVGKGIVLIAMLLRFENIHQLFHS